MIWTRRILILVIGLPAVLSGCAATRPAGDDAARERMLALLMPSRIEIVEPFTRVRGFAEESAPDGIELILQAVNALDNRGLMIAGHVRVELFEYIMASADNRGRRFEHWEIELDTARQQATYWNKLTQMYEFRLGIDRSRIPQADQFVLVVTYRSPLGDQLTDEFVIRSRPGGGSTGSVIGS